MVTIGAGIVLGLSAGFAPGPLLALVIAQTLSRGIREGIKVALAPLITDLPIMGAAVLMLAQLADSRPVLGAIALVGALFVAYLAWGCLRAGLPLSPGDGPGPGALAKGVLANALSPHPYVFWLSVGAPAIVQFWAQKPILALGFVAGFLGCLVGAKIVVAIAAGRCRRLLTPRAYGWTMKGLTAALLVFAAMLFRDGLEKIAAGF
jgi:threonine/homoserine/homoserine lactone efflux protein